MWLQCLVVFRPRPPGPIEASDLVLAPPKVNPSLEKAKAALGQVADAADGLPAQSGAAGLAQQALAHYKTLSDKDKGLDPDYKSPGAPDVPSQCMEDAQCRPCYTQAQATVDRARVDLEKVRSISEFTHKLVVQGEGLMNGVGSMSGGPAAIQASVETFKTEASLKDFDEKVKAKNQQLLENVQKGLQAIGACEAQFYKTDDWYNRYGFMYYQFILARYQ